VISVDFRRVEHALAAPAEVIVAGCTYQGDA